MAIKNLYADIFPDGTHSTAAWKQYGFDLDGVASTANSTGLCKVLSGASPEWVYPDGTNGIDNSFGRSVQPWFESIGLHISDEVNADIAQGAYTFLLEIAHFSPNQMCSTSARLYRGVARAQPPVWDGSDVWPLDTGFLSENIAYANVEVHDKKVRTVDSTEFDLLLLQYLPTRSPLWLPLQRTRIEFEFDSMYEVANGVIGGVMNSDNYAARVRNMYPFCDPDKPIAFDLYQHVRQSSDIMVSLVHDPTRECDALSVGFGIEMRPAKLGSGITPVAAQDPCNP